MFVTARQGDDMIDWMNVHPIHPAVVWGGMNVHPTLTHSIGGRMSWMNTSHLSRTKMEMEMELAMEWLVPLLSHTNIKNLQHIQMPG